MSGARTGSVGFVFRVVDVLVCTAGGSVGQRWLHNSAVVFAIERDESRFAAVAMLHHYRRKEGVCRREF